MKRRGFVLALAIIKTSTRHFKEFINMFIVSFEYLVLILRKIEDFPQDGGYSGALILEKCEASAENAGKENPLYQRIFNTSLSDMPKAYRMIPVK